MRPFERIQREQVCKCETENQPVCRACLQRMLMLPISMGPSCRDAALGPGARRLTSETQMHRQRSKRARRGQRRAHSPELVPATAFISGYTDLRNEGRAPNVLFFCFSIYPTTAPAPTPFLLSLYSFSVSAFYIAKELN